LSAILHVCFWLLRITFLEDEDLISKLFKGKHNVFREGRGGGKTGLALLNG
jgi:hypothetical protein